MERAPGRSAPHFGPGSFAWRLAGQYLPLAALALATVLILRNLAGGEDALSAPPASVAPNHIERLEANINFFETRVLEIDDSLSYNRLTGLYLQRVRETGDVSDIARAERSATRSLAVFPGDYAGLVNLALVRIAQHDFRAAAEIASRARAARPLKPDAYALLGDARAALGDYDGATENYRVFLEKAPGFSAFSRQAALAETRGKLALAEQFWLAAIDSDATDVPENSAWARVQLAHFYFFTGRIAESGDQYHAALQAYPGYIHALAGLARLAATHGDDNDAITLSRRATANVPVPEYVGALGDVYARARNPSAAAGQFAIIDAIRQLFDAGGVRSDLTLILFAADHGANTAEMVERAGAAYAGRPSIAAADVYAWALYRAGRFDEAATLAAEALRVGTEDPNFFFHAGMIAAARGEAAAARAWLQRALALNPNFSVVYATTAREALDRLREDGR
ncbi:MAG: tetratricopeptide repeat protein [Tepidiformaceae bacterium]